jgi:dTDP-4-dehydrorhamnose 3,5-epimerase-like enzyme
MIDLPVHGDERGSLVAVEPGALLPFPIGRVYYIYGTVPGVSRGFHAHRKLRQWAIAVSGSCTMLLDDGKQRATVQLDRPDKAIELPPMVWHEMHDFSQDAVMMMVADSAYDEADYIRSYDAFRTMAAAAPE